MLSGLTVEPFSVGSSKEYAESNYNELPECAASDELRELVRSVSLNIHSSN